MRTLLTFLIFLPFICPAQKVLQNVDAISGDTTFYTAPQRIHLTSGFGTAGEILSVAATKQKDLHTLVFSVITGKTSALNTFAGEKVNIKFADGSILTLTNQNDRGSKSFAGVTYGCTFDVICLLDEQSIETLKKQPVSFVRIHNSFKYFDYEINGKNAGKIQKVIFSMF